MYISFAAGDEQWADRVRVALTCLGHQERLLCWDPTDVAAGENEQEAVERAIDEAALAVLLVSMNYLISPRVKTVDVPRLLERRQETEMPLLVLRVSPCPWKTVNWLKKIQMLPVGGRALSSGDDHQIDSDLTDLAYHVNDRLP